MTWSRSGVTHTTSPRRRRRCGPSSLSCAGGTGLRGGALVQSTRAGGVPAPLEGRTEGRVTLGRLGGGGVAAGRGRRGSRVTLDGFLPVGRCALAVRPYGRYRLMPRGARHWKVTLCRPVGHRPCPRRRSSGREQGHPSPGGGRRPGSRLAAEGVRPGSPLVVFPPWRTTCRLGRRKVGRRW